MHIISHKALICVNDIFLLYHHIINPFEMKRLEPINAKKLEPRNTLGNIVCQTSAWVCDGSAKADAGYSCLACKDSNEACRTPNSFKRAGALQLWNNQGWQPAHFGRYVMGGFSHPHQRAWTISPFRKRWVEQCPSPSAFWLRNETMHWLQMDAFADFKNAAFKGYTAIFPDVLFWSSKTWCITALPQFENPQLWYFEILTTQYLDFVDTVLVLCPCVQSLCCWGFTILTRGPAPALYYVDMSTIYRALFGPKNNSPIIVKILFAFSCLDNHEQAVNIKNIQEHKNMLRTSIESSPQGEATLHGTLLDWNCGLKFEPSVDQISQLSYQVQRLSKVLIKGFQQIHLWSAKKSEGKNRTSLYGTLISEIHLKCTWKCAVTENTSFMQVGHFPKTKKNRPGHNGVVWWTDRHAYTKAPSQKSPQGQALRPLGGTRRLWCPVAPQISH